jgi:cobalt-zinc-cadmium efflux system outer membrane protein
MEQRGQQALGRDWGSVNESVMEEQLNSLRQDVLTVEKAVEIALRNNSSLLAALEEMGIAKADLTQEGLLKNPSLHAFVRRPDHEGKTNSEFEVRQDILSILTLPLRKRLSGLRLEQAQYALGEIVWQLDSEVKSAYYTLQAAKQMHAMQEKILTAEESAKELAQRQFAAGNVSDLTLTGRRLAFHQAQMDLRQRELDVSEAREHLGRLLGLSAGATPWDIADHLPYVSQTEPCLEDLETKALSQNFGLLMARQEIRVREEALRVNRAHALPEVQAGFNKEQESDGGGLKGPIFEVEVPLFDQKQTAIAKAKAQLRQSRHRLKAKEDEILSEVRLKHARLLAVKDRTQTYLQSVLPLRAQWIDSLQKHYNFMLIGIYDLLDAKKEEISSYHQFVESLKEYWLLRSELELLTGEKIKNIPADASAGEPGVQALSSPARHHHSSHGGQQ